MGVTLSIPTGAGAQHILSLTALRWIGGALPVAAREEIERCSMPAPPKRKRKRKPTLASVAKQAAKAGIEVARYEVAPDGKIIIVPGKPEIAPDVTERNEWDTVQ
jgi:hypothetical protein